MKSRLLILAVAFLTITIVGATWLGLTSLASGQALDDPAADRLRLISEETGLVASGQRLSPDCDYDRGYGVYLCPAPAPAALPQRDPAAAARAKEMLNSVGLLLMPDSTADRVIAFDPVTGDVVDENFIPPDPVNFSTPVNAIASASGNTILVSDQIRDLVQEYDLDGNYLGIFAPAGGANPAILDNIRGIALRPNGNLLVTVGSGANADSVAEFDTDGNYLGNFVAIGSGGLASPFDAYARPADWLVGGITSDIIHRYDLAGAYIADLAPINNFPEQIRSAANGNILIANFGGTQEGVVELTPDGMLVGVYNPASLGGYRGAYELPNGNILTTTGTGVYEINRAGAIVSTKITGVSGRFIEYLPPLGADLSVTKSATPAEVAPGDTVEYVVEFAYTDAPTGTATSIVLTDIVPGYLITVEWHSSVLITPTGGALFEWQVEDLAPGDRGTITITGEIAQGLAAGFTFTNTAVITSALADVNLDNNVAAVAVTILNAAPVALDDDAATLEEQPVTIPVLDNDSDPNGDPLTVVDPGTPLHGAATTDGTNVTYTPTLDFAGTDTFTYTIQDPGGLADTATVTLVVTPVNDPPVAVDDEATTEEEQPVEIVVLDNDLDPDGDPLVVISLTPPAHGTATTDGATITYTPTLNFAGVDTWTYTIADPGGLTATATVLVTVTEVNDPPTISEIADQVIYQDTSTGPVTFTIYDVETPAAELELSVTSLNLALVPLDQIVFGGSDITRTITVTPTAGMIGTSTITITVSDGTDMASETFLLTVIELEPPRFVVYLPIVTKAGP